eukprot:g2965.t1
MTNQWGSEKGFHVTASRIQRESVLEYVSRLPEGMVKSEMLKALDRVEKKIARELEAAQSAWAAEPVLKRIETSGITVRSSIDLLVLLTHCLMEESGLSCIGSLKDETGTAGSSKVSASEGDPASNATTSEAGEKTNDAIVPKGWNSDKGGVYGLKYVLPTSTSPAARPGESLTLKALEIGDVVSFHLVQERTGKSSSIELKVTDFVANKGRIIRADSIANLRSQLRSQLVDRLLPPPKDRSFSSSSSTTRERGRRTDLRVPLRRDPALVPPHYPPLSGRDPLRVPGIGGGDFDRDRLPHFGGGLGGGGIGGGGSLMGPNHPMFGVRQGGRVPRGPGRLPGARFDPYGPGVPRPNRPRRGGNMSGGPTPDHLPPPRFDGGGGIDDDDEPPSGMFF